MITDVSIIIVSWNVKELLRQCLQSIIQKTKQVTYEICVVDNASSDDTPNMVQRDFPQVSLIKNETNLGFAKANNQGISKSTGRYVLLLNPDTVVVNDAISSTITFLDGRSKASMATCKVLNSDLTIQECYSEEFPGLKTLVFGGSTLTVALTRFPLTNRFFNHTRRDMREYNRTHKVAWIMGAFMLVKRVAIEQVGLLDENLFMYNEETDWCYRMNKQHWEVWYHPEGEIIHYGGQSTQQSPDDATTNWLLTTRHYFFRKHYGVSYMALCYVTGALSTTTKLIIFYMISLLPLQSTRVHYVEYKMKLLKSFLRWYGKNSLFSLVKRAP